MTINEGLTLIKAIRRRISNLEQLRESVANETRYMGQAERVVVPQYDIKKVDSKLVDLEKMLFSMDNAIKKANAITDIGIEPNMAIIFDSLA